MANKEYIDKNRRWLEEKSREEGVEPLDKGIYYKVIKKGSGGGSTLIFDIELLGVS
ncbi:MAG: hypothetical protein K2L97_06795 [Muribaculaceae bacterium]|nr:hypothetical protein [Muribaculaceae bacterium]